MNVDKYRVETDIIGGKWAEINDVLKIKYDLRHGQTMADKFIFIQVDCVIDGKIAMLSGRDKHFNFIRKSDDA